MNGMGEGEMPVLSLLLLFFGFVLALRFLHEYIKRVYWAWGIILFVIAISLRAQLGVIFGDPNEWWLLLYTGICAPLLALLAPPPSARQFFSYSSPYLLSRSSRFGCLGSCSA